MNKIYTNEMVLVSKDFALRLHSGHKCIITGLEKWYHLESVADRIKKLNFNNNALLILSYLHDSLDYVDTYRRNEVLEEIRRKFGDYIVQLVVETTDNFRIEDISTSDGMIEFKKRKTQITSPGGISDDAAKVILAEKICNLSAIYDNCKKGPKDYWEKLKKSHNLNKDDIKSYYDAVYEALAGRCYGNWRLRPLIDEYDYLMLKIFH